MVTIFCIRPKGFNVGNDVIFMGLQHFLYEAFGQVVNLITIPATSRYESHAKAGLSAKTIYEINQYGDGVIVGGGNLYENGELEVDINALETLEVPMMLFSLSRGRIYNRMNKLVNRTDSMPDNVIRALHKKAVVSLARDLATYEYLQGIGCKNSQLGGCPTIFLDRIIKNFPDIHLPKSSEVLISVRNPALMNIPLPKQAQVLNELIAIINLLRGKGIKSPKLLCHDYRDISFAASIPGIDYIYTGDVYTYLALLRSCKLNVTYRLHSALPCLAFNTPMIKISYDERALSLMETINMDEWNIDMIKSDDVLRDVAYRLENLDKLSVLRQQAQETWMEQYSNMAKAFSLFAQEIKANKRFY